MKLLLSNSRIKAYLALLTTAAIWGIAGPVIKATLNYIPPFTFLFLRFGIVVIFTLPAYIFYLAKNPIKFSDLIPLSILGFMATTLTLGLIFLGFEKTTALDGVLLTSVTPIFIVFLGIIFLGEKITKREFLGLLFVVIGSIITVIQPFLEGKAFAYENSLGNIFILFAGLIWALFVLFSKKNFSSATPYKQGLHDGRGHHFSPLLITLHSSIIAFLTFLPLSIIEQGFKLPNYQLLITNYSAFLGIIYMAIPSYLIAYFLYEYGMSKIEISEGSVFSYLQPIFAAPVAVIFLHETITLPFLIGAGIIGIGVVLNELK